MSDYELTSLFYEAITITDMFLMNYVSLLFAFLIAGYLIADKLATPMAALLVTLFAVISLYFFTSIYFAQSDANEAARVIAERMGEGDFPLPNIGPSRNPVAFWVLIEGIATVGSFVGALVFFFYQRRHGRSRVPA